MTEQNLSACLILSAIGGIMGVLATAILAYPDAQKVRGKPWSPCAQCCALLLSLFFQLGIAIATIAATWFGPVSIVVPTSSSAQLLFNMCMFGVILGLESFTKSMRVGAYVVVLAAILLPVVGPGVQQNQDILALLQQTRSIVWSTLLLASLVISTVGLVLSNMRRKQQQQQAPTITANDYNMFVFNLMAQTSGAVVGTTVAKMFVLVEGAALGVCIAIWFVSSIILVYATILQATTVVQGKFVPLSVGTKIAVNALTGIIIWEDFLVVASWIGYVCVFLYLMLGNYLLCDVDVFGVQNQQYGTAKTLEKVKSVVLTDVQHLKTDSKESDVEMQEIHKQEQARQVTNNDQTDTVQAIKSNFTSEYGDWIPEEQETGSEGVLSSSTAEAEDYPSGIHPSSGEKEYITQRETPPPEAPQTESSVWRHAYNVRRNTKQSQAENADVVELDPSTASGVWRKAYHVKK